MSLLNAICTPGAVHLFQDTGLYASDRRLIGLIETKLVALPGIKAAMAGAGACFPGHIMKAVNSRAPATFEVLLNDLPDIAREMMSDIGAIQPETGVLLLAAGWSGIRRRVELWATAAGEPAAVFGPDYEPLTLVAFPESYSLISPGVPDHAVPGVDLTPSGLAAFDRFVDGAAIARYQRVFDFDLHGREHCIVSGAVHVISVTEEGLNTGLVIAWPEDQALSGVPTVAAASLLSEGRA